MSIVECMKVNKSYRQGKVVVHALREVDLSIEKGAFAALAEPSGSGKTTLLNLIGGLDLPDSGEIVVDANRYSTMNSSQLADLRLRSIGFVFQSFNLIPVLSALENVEYVMLLQGIRAKERQEKAKAILTEVGLEDKLHQRPAELSGGQQQRVAVARAIVSEPSIILADEPTANLDSVTGASILELMSSMNELEKTTFIFSTHDANVLKYARRIVRIKDGLIEKEPVAA